MLGLCSGRPLRTAGNSGRGALGKTSGIQAERKGTAQGQAEHRNVSACLDAREHGLDAVVFLPDKDAEKPEAEKRERSVSKAIEEAKRDFKLIVVGGVAIQRLESWVLACFGTRGSERMLRAEVDRRLSEAGVDAKRTESMVRLIESADSADLDRLPDDAHSLRTWLDEARGLAATD